MPLNQHIARAPRRGMIVRSKETIGPGVVVFKLGHRFDGNTRQSDLEVISTPWWFTKGTIELISKASASSGSRMSELFRQFGAIAKRWNGSGDLIVKADIDAPLTAYIGPGTIQDFRGVEGQEANNLWDMPLWVPSPSTPQIYIPLMKKGDIASSVAADALTNVYIVPIDKWDDSFINGNPKDRWSFRK